MSTKFTISFSNTPGPIKPFFYIDIYGKKIRTIHAPTYMICAGKIGLNIAVTTFCNSFTLTASSDDNVFDENEELGQLIEGYLRAEIKRNNV